MILVMIYSALMLDQRMIYSCGYWKGADNLDQAQVNKLDSGLQKTASKARNESSRNWLWLGRFCKVCC